ncbi:phosphate acyltransferase PlsX [Allofustis seminis]|uniref:phosphate acyltransferase PlsX n=1 Tax=Allofustis seminis TaxID=166939 RepID=UPI00036542F9|nr:phosphate acyltransferase PlsX [Allofustis seminis]
MKIAIDAMGGDRAPQVIVEGAQAVAEEYSDVIFTLYGDPNEIKKYLTQKLDNIQIIETTEVITGEDDPVRSIRRKVDSSLVRAARDVKEGLQDGLFSAGNTGALLSAGTLIVGRIPGVFRPALMVSLPNFGELKRPTIFLDLGANSETKPEFISQFGVLGSFFAKALHNAVRPSVALLNNGAEEGKGNQITKEAHQLLKENKAIHFVGNIEARDMLRTNVDVVVADGFVGNAVLKAMEGTALTMSSILKEAIISSGIKGKVGGLLLKDSLRSLRDSTDYSKLGGAILIGVNAPVMKTHGATNAEAVSGTLKQMITILHSNIINELKDYFVNERKIQDAENDKK